MPAASIRAALVSGLPRREHAMIEQRRLSLHVPEPSVRPGDKPDFHCLSIPRAGAVRRPPVDVPAHEIYDLAYSIIRVLDRQGEAVGPWAPGLDVEALKSGLQAMLKTRAYDGRMMMRWVEKIKIGKAD
jgi:2-oxoisovalerate dehydrogenase E1 component alpha subunit